MTLYLMLSFILFAGLTSEFAAYTGNFKLIFDYRALAVLLDKILFPFLGNRNSKGNGDYLIPINLLSNRTSVLLGLVCLKNSFFARGLLGSHCEWFRFLNLDPLDSGYSDSLSLNYNFRICSARTGSFVKPPFIDCLIELKHKIRHTSLNILTLSSFLIHFSGSQSTPCAFPSQS